MNCLKHRDSMNSKNMDTEGGIGFNKSKQIILCMLLSICGVVIYSQVLTYGYVPYDDPAYITGNKFVAQGISAEGVRWSFLYDSELGDLQHKGVENLWHPLTWLSHMLDVEMFGIEGTGGQHAVSLALFILSGMLVMWVMGMISGSVWAGFLVALLWMVHPLKVESVAWLSERKDVLSGLFFWASLGCVMKGMKGKTSWYRAGYGFFLIALLSKPSVVILPVLILLVEGYLNKEKKWGITYFVEGIKRWWLWFSSAAAVTLIAIIMQSSGSHDYFVQQSSMMSRMMTSGAGLWFYLLRIVVPVDLVYEYPQPVAGRMLYIVAWLGVIGIGVLVWMKRPVSGLVYVGSSFTADRYLYLGLAGLLFIPMKEMGNSRVLMGISIGVALIWSFLSWKQVSVWRDGFSLFTHATESRPRLSRAWVNLGKIHENSGDMEQAENCYRKTIELNANSYTALYNLANILNKKGDIDGARAAYEKSIIAYPEHLPSLLNLGILKFNAKEIAQARDLFAKGIGKDIRMMVLCCECEMRLGNIEQARAIFKKIENVNTQNLIVVERIKRLRVELRGFR